MRQRNQQFNAPVGNVAGHNIFISHGSESPVQPGAQQWIQKHYIVGRSMTAGWLALLCFVLLIGIGLTQLVYHLRALFMHNSHSEAGTLFFLWMAVMVAVMLGTVAACQVAARGFFPIPRTQHGIVRDMDRHVFVGKLGGEGSCCPFCKQPLYFQESSRPPLLKCTRNPRPFLEIRLHNGFGLMCRVRICKVVLFEDAYDLLRNCALPSPFGRPVCRSH